MLKMWHCLTNRDDKNSHITLTWQGLAVNKARFYKKSRIWDEDGTKIFALTLERGGPEN